ncbi:chemotaxis protein CheY [Ruminiclostridium hungatei]|uniref:Stage 0 sporulation protein A homolog n=1 Tax=Ruminiclostridium hungatei TaxID=48256 RepID=A0A1V4SPQ5_RUMHU|nr:response regulator [Ruminiclostridium hungatei]OPX45842.1 chemotaxis protein CheY [Ruminiclostridium hungatei]
MSKVLVVDDAIFMRQALKLILERNGFTVVGEAENGRIAIQKYKELTPDLVTMDITMPEVDGIEAVKAIKAINPGSRIVMISALGQESHIREAIMVGASGFIVKPFREENIVKALGKYKGEAG